MKVLVTGGARGLGLVISLYYLKMGHSVVVNYNNSSDLALKLKSEYGDRVSIVKADVSNEDDVKRMFDALGKLDVVVNNAGIAKDSDPMEKSAEEFLEVIKVNLLGTFLVSKYAVNHVDKGCIVNISSTNALDTYYPESMDYDASKAGVISLTHNFSLYLKDRDIRVNVVCPDWIDTDMNLGMDEEYKKSLGVFLKPEEVAKVVYDVSIDESVNDVVIRVGDNSVK
ncbi:MAG: SDR family oxidoreductase [Bacilli bacterium]|nr:SDR family oxidoreductase [Bacilli bacterium]